MEKQHWGELDGLGIYLFTLVNRNGIRACITNYGAIITELHAPDRRGRLADIALGCRTLRDYLKGHPYFGCIVGRCANRIANGQFVLDGKSYQLAVNNGPNHLHGGKKGFDKVVWSVVETQTEPDFERLTLYYCSHDREENYPGCLKVQVIYTLNDRNELKVEMRATTDAPTIVNLAQHAYWNLAGHDSGSILEHELTLYCSYYTPSDAQFIPTGQILEVKGTPFDFKASKTIGREIQKLPPGEGNPGGYDINLIVDGEPGVLRRAALVYEPNAGRTLEVLTDAPGVQFYSGNFLDGSVSGKSGKPYHKHAGFCLETQHFPDAINKTGASGWLTPILQPGQEYRHNMVLRFAVR